MSAYIVGLAGGIGSGKTAASDWFSRRGIDIIDTDVLAREVVRKNSPALTAIKNHFGDWVLLENGELDRTALREYIFQHAEAREQLEHITHPAIRQLMQERLTQANSTYAILVSPLLFEKQQHLLTHRTLLIDVPEHLQLQRASQRDQHHPAQIQKIIDIQMSRTEKLKLADDVIVNDQDLNHLYQKLEKLHQFYLQQAQQYQQQQ
ncbi:MULTISPECIES: dephospho-CoA kinase [unclassified Acinetobacter]|uniref:dephospho-CoA kinase n=1 Tax=unclassified Acinetobacter TaxID=196816 RepID=UPI0035B810CD